MRIYPFFLAACFFPLIHYGQQSPQRCRYVPEGNREFVLDSLTVVASSIVLDPSLDFLYDPQSGLMQIADWGAADSVKICYSVLPFDLNRTYYRRSRVEEMEDARTSRFERGLQDPVAGTREELFPTEQLQKSGSLSRGIAFGNTQNVVVNSALNLQFEGKLTEEVNVRASITDQNVPFQPEGNTAQIQDFDNVFFEFYNDNFSLRGGDIVLQNRESEFLRYYKNVQGGLLQTEYNVGKSGKAQTTAGISVAKGKFASLQLEVQEGVAGPYRIRIPDASDFIIILANSEKVFLDGRLLERGFSLDYVIDYDRAEIQFTARVLITKFSRVRIDVEYSDRNYSRRILAASHYQRTGRLARSLNAYSEKDNPNRPLSFELSESDKMLLEQVGDSLELAVTASAVQTPFSQDQILYEQIDTVDNDNRPQKIFRYSINPEAVLYRVAFKLVGPGKGDYNPFGAELNGRAFEWVSPQNGMRMGQYTPETVIPAPSQKNMFTVGLSYDLSEYDQLYAEMAATKNDLNLLSDKDGEDDQGYALKTGYRAINRPVDFMPGYRFSANLDYEYDSRYFVPIDRFRYIEFDRDWSYNPQTSRDQTPDNIVNAGVGVERNPLNRFVYELSARKRVGYIDGTQHKINAAKEFGRFRTNVNAFLLRNTGSDQFSTWNRVEWDTKYVSRLIVPGYRFHLDRNELSTAAGDSITGTAMNFVEHVFYLHSNDTLRTQFGIEQSFREDRLPQGGEMAESDRASLTSLFLRTSQGGSQDLTLMVTYRDNNNLLASGGPQPEQTLIGRCDWFGQFFERHIRSDLSYAIGSGRELKRNYVYVRTETGLGTHTWRDDNGDGIQTLDEFYLAINSDERNFIKILLPSEEYVFAYENNFNYRLNVEMPRNWRKATGLKGLLSRLSANASWSSIRRMTSEDLRSRLLPFYVEIDDADLLSARESLRGRLFFNRTNPGLGFDIGYQRNGNRQLLVDGFESRNSEEYSGSMRANLSRKYSIKATVIQGRLSSGSDYLLNRNYAIQRSRVGPELSWQPNSSFRFSTEYYFTSKSSPGTSDEASNAVFHEITGILRWNDPVKHMLNAVVRFVDIAFDGVENSPLGYDMLEALRPGRNITWNVVFQKKIISGLQLSLNYEGRSSAGSPVIHIGRMQVSALF